MSESTVRPEQARTCAKFAKYEVQTWRRLRNGKRGSHGYTSSAWQSEMEWPQLRVKLFGTGASHGCPFGGGSVSRRSSKSPEGKTKLGQGHFYFSQLCKPTMCGLLVHTNRLVVQQFFPHIAARVLQLGLIWNPCKRILDSGFEIQKKHSPISAALIVKNSSI